MPIDPGNQKLFKLAEHVGDQDLDQGERLALAKDLIEGVKGELAENIDAVKCVAEGQLSVAIAGVDMALGFLG